MLSYNDFDNFKYDKTLYEHNENISALFIKYVTVINDFINYAINNLPENLNTTLKSAIKQGVNALTHIFNLTLLKNNDIDYTIDITQKCFFYYVEFVTQISNSQDHIQLSLNDAIIFLYKKSIFQFDSENKTSEPTELSPHISLNLKKLIDIHNELLYYYISVVEYHNNSFNDFTKKIYVFTENIITIKTNNNILNIKNLITYCEFNKINFINIIDCINIFTNHINNKYVNSNDLFIRLIKSELKLSIIADAKYNVKKMVSRLLTSL